MTKFFSALVFVLFGSFSAYAKIPTGIDKVSQLMDVCKTSVRYTDRDTYAVEDGYSAYLCIGYMKGIADSVTYYYVVENSKALCFSPETAPRQNIAIFIKWAENHPENWNMPSALGVFLALQEKYPCK